MNFNFLSLWVWYDERIALLFTYDEADPLTSKPLYYINKRVTGYFSMLTYF